MENSEMKKIANLLLADRIYVGDKFIIKYSYSFENIPEMVILYIFDQTSNKSKKFRFEYKSVNNPEGLAHFTDNVIRCFKEFFWEDAIMDDFTGKFLKILLGSKNER